MARVRKKTLKPAGPWRMLAGVGGIGTGMFFALDGDHTLGRNESRPGRLLDVRDYCKLHIIAHYVAVLLGARPSGRPFHVLPIGKVGDDETGRRLTREMAEAGMDVRFVEPARGHPTLLSVCFQYPDGSGGNITTSDAAAARLTNRDIDRAKAIFPRNKGRLIALAAPEAPLEARKHFLEVATRYGAFRAAAFTSAEIVEARDSGMLRMVDLVSINEDEAGVLVGRAYEPRRFRHFLVDLESALVHENDCIRIVLSAGKEGAHGYERGVWNHCPAAEVEVRSTAGAGDALLATALAGIAAGWPLVVPGPPRASITDRPLASALDFAVLVASFKCTSPHTIHPRVDLDSVLAFARTSGITFDKLLKGSWAL
jgi:ribokinase